MRFIFCVVIFGLFASVASAAEADWKPFMGISIDEAKSTDFFKHFHLKERLKEPEKGADGFINIVFAPENPEFAKNVALNVRVDERSIVRGAVISIKRKFIENQKTAIFARDYAKSFLVSAITSSDGEAVGAVASDIWYRVEDSGFEVRPSGTDAIPKLPAERTPGYEVFLGKRTHYRMSLPRTEIKMFNKDGGRGDVLHIGSFPTS